MTKKAALAATIAALASSVAACGGSDAGADHVKDATRAWFRDLARGDGRSACARLTGHARRQFASQFVTDELLLGRQISCEESVERVSGALTQEEQAAIDGIEIQAVDTDGDEARISDDDLELPAALWFAEERDDPTLFVRVRGRWLLQDFG